MLKEFRKTRGLTQETAAAELGISVRTLQNWEIARNMPGGFGLKALLAVLGAEAPVRPAERQSAPAASATEVGFEHGDDDQALETHLL